MSWPWSQIPLSNVWFRSYSLWCIKTVRSRDQGMNSWWKCASSRKWKKGTTKATHMWHQRCTFHLLSNYISIYRYPEGHALNSEKQELRLQKAQGVPAPSAYDRSPQRKRSIAQRHRRQPVRFGHKIQDFYTVSCGFELSDIDLFRISVQFFARGF